MKNFKNLLVASFLTIGAFASTMMVSCNPDPCKDVVCANGGTCDDVTGACKCAAGYEGTGCDSLSRDKFLNTNGTSATWLTGVSADGCYAPGYTMTIDPSADNTQLIIKNFAGYGTSANVTVTVNGNAFTQTTPVTAGAVTISGVSGTINTDLNPDKITFVYSATDTAGTITCSSSALKQ